MSAQPPLLRWIGRRRRAGRAGATCTARGGAHVTKKDKTAEPLLIRISGRAIEELKRHTYLLGDAFDLDLRIEEHLGGRPIPLHRHDLECLLTVLDEALTEEGYWVYAKSRRLPSDRHGRARLPTNDPGAVALKTLRTRLRRAYETAFQEQWSGRRRGDP